MKSTGIHVATPTHAGSLRGYNHMSSPLASASSSSSPLTTGLSASCRGGARLAKTTLTATQQRSSPRHMLKPGPLGLGLGKAGPAEDSNTLSGLRRQQFRQKCQDAMSRDRKLDRGRKLAREYRSTAGTDSDDDDDDNNNRHAKMVMFSDDLSSSDVDEDTREEREMEMARRVLAVDYRKMIREQERSGQIEVGWLDPDEVAWLEEEMKREEAQAWQGDFEPPADMFDEDEELSAQYEHAQSRMEKYDSGSEDDFSWLSEEEWQRAIEGAERNRLPLERLIDDVVMSDG